MKNIVLILICTLVLSISYPIPVHGVPCDAIVISQSVCKIIDDPSSGSNLKSADDRFVSFESLATTLDKICSNGGSQFFVLGLPPIDFVLKGCVLLQKAEENFTPIGLTWIVGDICVKIISTIAISDFSDSYWSLTNQKRIAVAIEEVFKK